MLISCHIAFRMNDLRIELNFYHLHLSVLLVPFLLLPSEVDTFECV